LRYVSTRGKAPALAFDDVLLAGLAADGGLYVPETFPRMTPAEWDQLVGRRYEEVALAVMRPFVGDTIADDDLAAMIANAYATFAHRAVAPLRQLERGDWFMELFHGPTLAFKDVALQLVGRMFDHVLARGGRRVTIVGATSGDTGSAAMEACRDRAAIDVFILYPQGRVTEVQRRQMTTLPSPNVHAIAIEGSFDDCQDLVKAMFNDAAFRQRHNLSAVNSINWARVMAQVVYYAWAALSLGGPARPVSFAVPTGNFGNVYAGYVAWRMGLPIQRLVVGSNRNDILTRFFQSADMSIAEVVPTTSPSMDIQVSSNFERFLFDLLDRDGAAVAETLGQFRAGGKLPIAEATWRRSRTLFEAWRFDESEILGMMGELHRATGELIEPHSAIGIGAGRAYLDAQGAGDQGAPMIALGTAHPAKFAGAVETATGVRPALPARLAGVMERPERVTLLPNDLKTVEAHIAARATPA
jgi:threonine synthase